MERHTGKRAATWTLINNCIIVWYFRADDIIMKECGYNRFIFSISVVMARVISRGLRDVCMSLLFPTMNTGVLGHQTLVLLAAMLESQ